MKLEQIQAAEAVIRRFFPPTPVLYAPRLSQRFGTEVWLKLESCTPIRTFKLRGALNKLQALADVGVQGGVVTASAGNHGLAVARAARLFGRPAAVVVPEGANPQKVSLIAAEGAKVVHHGQDYQAAFEHCQTIGQAEGLTLVHAYDDPLVIAGQGSIGVELAAAGVEFDTILMGVGGGGLISGVAAALKAMKPEVRVIGVQPAGADSMVRSLATGQVVALERVQTIADGLGARMPGEHTLELVRRHVDEIRTVSDQHLWEAMKVLLREERLVAESSGIAGLATLLDQGASGLGRILVLVTGANISDEVLEAVIRQP